LSLYNSHIYTSLCHVCYNINPLPESEHILYGTAISISCGGQKNWGNNDQLQPALKDPNVPLNLSY